MHFKRCRWIADERRVWGFIWILIHHIHVHVQSMHEWHTLLQIMALGNINMNPNEKEEERRVYKAVRHPLWKPQESFSWAFSQPMCHSNHVIIIMFSFMDCTRKLWYSLSSAWITLAGQTHITNQRFVTCTLKKAPDQSHEPKARCQGTDYMGQHSIKQRIVILI